MKRDDLIDWQIALEVPLSRCRFESEAWDFYAMWWGAVCHKLYPLRCWRKRRKENRDGRS